MVKPNSIKLKLFRKIKRKIFAIEYKFENTNLKIFKITKNIMISSSKI